MLTHSSESYTEALSYVPDLDRYNRAPDLYVEYIHQLKQAVSMPIIGNLNGVSTGGWIEYAQPVEQAGADALELNLYHVPTEPTISAAMLEERYVTLVRDVRARLRILIALKPSPFFTSLPHMAQRFADSGANALVLFNRL